MTTLLVVRHGQTTWNREGRVQGWAPTDLTDRGREQASALGRWLGDRYSVDRILASDLRRTRETTAELRAAADGLPEAGFDPGWRERGFGVYQGLLTEELFERFPDHDRRDSVSSLDVAPENGERIPEFRRRVQSAWDRATATTRPGETTLVVTHGGAIKVLLGELTDRDPDATLADHSQDNCAVNEFRIDEGAKLVGEALTDWRELSE